MIRNIRYAEKQRNSTRKIRNKYSVLHLHFCSWDFVNGMIKKKDYMDAMLQHLE